MAEELDKQKSREKQNANLKVFKKYSELSAEELERQKAIVEKAKEKTREYHQKRKGMNELAKALLDSPITREQAVRILGDDAKLLDNIDIEGMTVSQVLNAVMVQESIKGNVRAYEALRDTAGYSPKKELEISADIMTDADRELLLKINGRIG